MAFVDKVKKNGVEYDIHDTEGRVKIDGTSLIIPEQPAPEPVGEFDGVKYYHKCEFDLTNLGFNESKYDAITGKKFEDTPTIPYIYSYFHGHRDVDLMLRTSDGYQYKQLYHNGSTVAYESQAFVVTKDESEVTSEGNKIYFASDEYDIAAYYGFLSEDGKTFISYYNFENEGPEFIDSIKQGDNVVPIAQAGGCTKLYKHVFPATGWGGPYGNFEFISTSAEPVNQPSDVCSYSHDLLIISKVANYKQYHGYNILSVQHSGDNPYTLTAIIMDSRHEEVTTYVYTATFNPDTFVDTVTLL